MPPSGTSRSIMSLFERRGFKQREKGAVVIGTALPVVLQFAYEAGTDVASLYTWQCLISVYVKSPQLFISGWVIVLLYVCMYVCAPSSGLFV